MVTDNIDKKRLFEEFETLKKMVEKKLIVCKTKIEFLNELNAFIKKPFEELNKEIKEIDELTEKLKELNKQLI